MPLKERITDVDELRSWKDEIPFHFVYTAGVAGERFLRGLAEGKILASKCPKCRRSYLPPKMYCVDCYVEMTEYVDVGTEATVSSLAESWVGFNGEKTVRPKIFGFLTFKGVAGGLVHFVSEDGVRIGNRVTARFKPSAERKGDLLDIECFVRQLRPRPGSTISSSA